jgi:hypothetical protein
MNKIELEKIYEFKMQHEYCYYEHKKDASKFKIILKATGIGESVVIKCCACKERENVTDYGDW